MSDKSHRSNTAKDTSADQRSSTASLKKITHAGKTTLRMTSILAHAQVIMTALTTISIKLKQTATQLAHHDRKKSTTSPSQPWDNLITRIFMPYIAARAGPQPIP